MSPYLRDLIKQSVALKALSRVPGLAASAAGAGRISGGAAGSKKRRRAAYGMPAALFAVLICLILYAVLSGNFFPHSDRIDRRLSGLGQRIKNDPNDIQAYFESGLLKFEKGPSRYIDAISDLETARSRGLADIRVFYYLGRMYQAVGLYDFSLEEYRRYLNNRPDDLEVRMLSAKLLFSSGKYALAVKEYEDLSGKHPKNAAVLENLALSRWKNGQDPGPELERMNGMGGEASFRAGYISGLIDYENKNYGSASRKLERAAADMVKYPRFQDRAALRKMLEKTRPLLARLNKARRKAAANRKKQPSGAKPSHK